MVVVKMEDLMLVIKEDTIIVQNLKILKKIRKIYVILTIKKVLLF